MDHFEDLATALERNNSELIAVFERKTKLIGRDGIFLKFKIQDNVITNLFILTVNSLFGTNWRIHAGSHYNLYLYVLQPSNPRPQPKDGVI